MDKLQRFMGYDQKENYERLQLIIIDRLLYELEWSIIQFKPSVLTGLLSALTTGSRYELYERITKKEETILKTHLMEDFKKIHKNLKTELISGEDMERCDDILKNHYHNNLSIWNEYTLTLEKFVSLVYKTIYSYFLPFLFDFDYRPFDYFCLTLYIFFLIKQYYHYFEDKFHKPNDILKIKKRILNEVSNIIRNYNLIYEVDNYETHSNVLIDYISNFIDEMYKEEINIYSSANKGILIANEKDKWFAFLFFIISKYNPILAKHTGQNLEASYYVFGDALLTLEDKLIENNVYDEILKRICEDKEYRDHYLNESDYLFQVQHLSHRFLENIIFTDACVTIPRNQWICFHGNSGCGKTTLCKMLLKKLTPNEGKITYMNNNNSCEYEYENLRSHISFVDPNSDIFNETILYNLTYGINEMTEEVYKTMYYYMYYFQLDKYVDRLQENIGKLSTGEKQRIKVIRLILHDKPIWMIDEITSNVDNDTEKIILQKLKEIQLEKKKSVIHITHNLENMVFADKKMYIREQKIFME